MSHETAKYILWIFVSIPFALLCLYLLNDILGDAVKIRRAEKAKLKAERAKLEKRALDIRKRAQFEDEYKKRHGGFY